MMIDVLLNALVPIFAIMALGYFAGWIRDVDNHRVAELNALVMDFALPASLFVATASTSGAVLSEQWPLLVVFTVSMLALYALSYWTQRHLFGLGSGEAAVQALTIALPNYAAAGLPLIAAVLGPAGTRRPFARMGAHCPAEQIQAGSHYVGSRFCVSNAGVAMPTC
jgi:malonate transporter